MIWVRRVVPMLIGAGLLYLAWRLVTANGAEVEIDLVIGRLEGVALWQALGSAFLTGVLLVGIVLVLQAARTRLTMRRYQKQLAGLETEVHQLRNLPLAPLAPGELPSEPVEMPALRGGAASLPS